MRRKNNLIQGPVGKTLVSLTIPMLFGMFSMVLFNLVDAFFISRLGTRELAAIGFTFPVIMFVSGIALGLGVAAASVVSRAIGRGEQKTVRRLATDSLAISIVVVAVLAWVGLRTISPVFRMLDADASMLVLIRQYMEIWYIGTVFVVVPMVGNNVLRASGDTLYPALLMMISTVLNIILDPLLIFGLAGFPRMELAGAALATVIARGVTCVCSLAILHYRERLLDFRLPRASEFAASVRQILYIAVPSSFSRILLPAATAVITRLVAQFGAPAVAALGAAVRVEMFVFTVIMALATALIPFVGQNWGARRYDRVNLARRYSRRFSLGWGLVLAVVLFFSAGPVARIFSADPEVVGALVWYLRIIPLSYGMRSLALLTASVFNAVNKPLIAGGINVIRMFGLYVPFSYLGAWWGGLPGLFAGLCLANISAGIITEWWGSRLPSTVPAPASCPEHTPDDSRLPVCE
ncbi:MAG: MATE family efflux transporter [Candidatus Omnitrophica bacterium]|nr:MATE family efflux transporter [Candidatus Omnitrophota bacterium]